MTSITFETRDEFQRRPVAEKVITLLQSDIDISPMVIDGGWGTGKTEFCQKLIQLMKIGDTSHLIYIDAFQADHANEPLLTLLSGIIKLIPEGIQRKSFIEKAKPAIRFGAKAVGKALVAHALRQEANDIVNDFDKEVQKVADKALDASVNALIKDHVQSNQNLNSLQTALEELGSSKPIIIFIDELDRCRPDFAVSMLEVIKHTFNVPSLKFVLVTNTQQLRAAINNSYGDEVDANRYLDKFLKFRFTLPEIVPSVHAELTLASVNHYQRLVRSSQTLDNTELWQHSDFNLVRQYIRTNNTSLREVETLVRHIEIYHQLSNREALSTNKNFSYRLLRLFGVLVFTFHNDVADHILRHKADAAVLTALLGERGIVQLRPEDSHYPEHHQVLLAMIGTECLHNSSIYDADEGYSESQWASIIQDYFRGVGKPHNCLDVTKQAINLLSLS
ncbi:MULTISPECIES: P-loop NTPase fold protein [Vibrio]|uniref:KAP family P-loop NTPase fold protein n=3 Tax=Vibrionaceae TaxID=641 RepID=UPI0002E77231|nr:KAP family NTPase [Vibrio tasmaniensis]OEF68772.1 AAA family ATPase [Vibrio tasmaniensis 1F-155]PMO74965.1 AAA family ATPase [Vibrio tasmaniensis]